jgi:hypothetical protein
LINLAKYRNEQKTVKEKKSAGIETNLLINARRKAVS